MSSADMTSDAVLGALGERIRTGSRPGQREDSLRIVVSIEGGGSRSAYSAGMALAIDELGLLAAFDAVYGTSGGALNAAWLVSGEGARWLPSWGWDDVLAERVVNAARVLRGGVVVDTRHLTEHVYSAVTPMNFAAILASPISLHPLATDAATRRAADLAPLITDESSLRAALRASAALPLLAGKPVRLGGRDWFDGGLAEKVPLATPVAQGATHVMVLRTVSEIAESARNTAAASPSRRAEQAILGAYFALRRAAPAPNDPRQSRSPDVPVLDIWVPENSPAVGRLSRDGALITSAVETGREAALNILAGVLDSAPGAATRRTDDQRS